jgi:signal transduction histidine kinase
MDAVDDLRAAVPADPSPPPDATIGPLIDALARMGQAEGTREVLEHLVAAAGSLTGATSAAVQILEADGSGSGGLARELVSWSAPPAAARSGRVAGSAAAYHLDRPVTLDRDVTGVLQLRAAHPFSGTHDQLVATLAGGAERALLRARTLAQATHQLRRLEAVAEVQDALLSTMDTTAVLRLVAHRALEVVGADTSAVLVPTGADGLIVEVASGRDAQHIAGRRVRRTGTRLGDVLTTGRTLIVDDDPAGPTGSLWSQDAPRAALLVPLRTSQVVRGVLLVATFGAAGLGLTEASVLGSFAGQAALAIERAQARDDRLRVSLYEDRERIARDLHDHVIQRLFAAGLALSRWADRATQPEVADGVRQVVDDIDLGITEIRTLIHQLQSPPDRESFQAAIRDIVGDASAALGFPVTLEARSRADLVPDHLREDVLAVLREALSNVVRHARAQTVRVEVRVDDEVCLTVQDDGVGASRTDRRSGLANLARRAESHGGRLRVDPARPGTRLLWQVPAGPPQA